MGEVEPAGVPVHRRHRRQDILVHPEAGAGVGDAGHGDVLQGDEAGHAAAQVHERAEFFQVGHPGGQNRARRRVLQQPRHGLLLGRPAGEGEPGPAAAVHVNGRDGEAGGLPHPGEDGDVPFRAADGGVDCVQPGDGPLVAAEADGQIPLRVAADGHAGEDGLILHCQLEGAEGLVVWKQGARALR